MQEYYSILLTAPLFSGVSEQELAAMLTCLDPQLKQFAKDEFLLRVGEKTDTIGLVLTGSALIVQEDIWGNRNILSKAMPGQSFAAAFACAPDIRLNISVVAETSMIAMFLNVKRILQVCPSACAHHSRIIQNLLSELAEKNLRCNEKLIHTGQRTTRAKLMSYFSAEAQRAGSYSFTVPFSRQQLADYLGVERSGLSAELSKLKNDGVLDYCKNHIILNDKK